MMKTNAHEDGETGKNWQEHEQGPGERLGHHLHLLTENTANSEEDKMEALLSTSNHRTCDCRDQKHRQSPDIALLS